MRKPHFLYKPQRAPYPRYCFFLDCETGEKPLPDTKQGKTQVESTLNMGWAAYVRRDKGMKWFSPEWYEINPDNNTTAFSISMDHKRDLWRWITRKIPNKSKAYLFMHNVGFDFPVLQGFDILPELGWMLTNFIMDDPPTMLEFQFCPKDCGFRSGATWREESKCREPHKTLVVIDTLNYFRMSLANIGKNLGSEKLNMPTTGNGKFDVLATKEQKDKYCKQDVQVLIDTLQEYIAFIDEHSLGSFQMTQAAQSFTAYRHRFMPRREIYIDDNEKALEISRCAYYGGRVEAFQIGEISGIPSYKLDINSMYPYIMKAHEYPVKLKGVWGNVDMTMFVRQLYGRFKYTAEVELETNEPVYPYYQNERLVFPIGRFSTFLTTPEIDYAYRHNHIKHIRRIAFYTSASIFSSFVNYFYDLRMRAKADGDETQSFFLKIIMNSLYGKFGQNGRKWKTSDKPADFDDIKIWSDIFVDTGEVTQFRQVGKVVQMLEQNAESMNSHPAIAAHITGESRIYLWELIKQAGRENVYYCDTDSLFVNDRGRDNLHGVLDPDKLGALKLEDVSDHLVVRGLKDYEFGDTIKLKGVRDPANPVAPNTYKLVQFRGLRGALRHFDLSRVIITEGTKTLKRNYTKGIITRNGRVRPLEIGILKE